MTAVLIMAAVWIGFAAGWFVRGGYELAHRRNRRGGYVRRVPMASVHPRRSAAIDGFHDGAESYRRRFTNGASVHPREPKP